jgi:putative pyruvate formate lyase activating enzyme
MICNLCPRRCGALRTETAGEGFCRMPAQLHIARAGLHHWEEPVISGTRGSGAVFFSGCTNSANGFINSCYSLPLD